MAAPLAAPAPAPADHPVPSRIGLIGNPNVGKSVLFGRLSGRYAAVSNYPGTTVEVCSGTLSLEGRRVPIVDTPGANGLVPQSEDERVTRDLLLEGPATVLQVADAKNLPRALALSLQIAEARLPLVLALNMTDEAESLGLRIDAERLSGRLGVDVVSTVATHGAGVAKLPVALTRARPASFVIDYGERIESAVSRLTPLLPDAPIAGRSLALALLSGDATLSGWLRGRLAADRYRLLEEALESIPSSNGMPAACAIQQKRIAAAESLAGQVTSREGGPAGASRARGELAPGGLAMHPILGIPILAGVLFSIYQFVGVLGAQVAVEWFERTLFGAWINPRAQAFFARWSPWDLLTDLIVGPYGLLTMGLTYAIAIVLPIVATFFFAFAVLEDSGYLPRLAVMLNRPFRLMGLNGRAVLPMILGLGCDTMATLTSRILSTRKERTIVVLLLALGVPCSAQLGVILGMLASLSFRATAVWGCAVVGVLLLVGWLAARLLPGERAGFVLEIPPLRWPRPVNLLRKTLARMEWYLKEAVPLFLLGTLVLFAADRLGLLARLVAAARPVVTTLLGLPEAAAEAFIVGFLRRDFGAAGLYRLAEAGLLDPVQIVVALVTMTLFIPCIANFFMIVKEQGARAALAMAAFIFPFAILAGAALNVLLRGLKVAL